MLLAFGQVAGWSALFYTFPAQLARYEDAEELLERAILLENPDTQSLNLLGLARFQVSDFIGAREAFQRSLALDAEQPQVEEALTRVAEAERGAQSRPQDGEG